LSVKGVVSDVDHKSITLASEPTILTVSMSTLFI
jgi:hypothetical protein